MLDSKLSESLELGFLTILKDPRKSQKINSIYALSWFLIKDWLYFQQTPSSPIFHFLG